MTLTVRNTSKLRAANLVATDRCGPATVPVPLLRLRPGRDTTVQLSRSDAAPRCGAGRAVAGHPDAIRSGS